MVTFVSGNTPVFIPVSFLKIIFYSSNKNISGMEQKIADKTCLSCGKILHGRLDKKYCNDSCRNNYNNELRSSDNNYVRNVNNALRKNCRILEQCFNGERKMAKTTRDKLVKEGFNFKYITHTYTNKKGNVYRFCYYVGYLPLENDWYLVVNNSEE